MNSTLHPLFDSNPKRCKGYNTLIELTNRQLKRWKDNSIHISNFWFDSKKKNKNIYYKNMTIGTNINTTKRNDLTRLNLHKSKKNMIIITASKEECL